MNVVNRVSFVKETAMFPEAKRSYEEKTAFRSAFTECRSYYGTMCRSRLMIVDRTNLSEWLFSDQRQKRKKQFSV